jgi:hypothetical protein
MTTNKILLVSTLLLTFAHATDKLTLSYENLHFSGSKKKDQGQREGIKYSHKEGLNQYEILYERTDTKTYQPPLSKDLAVNKYYVKYSRTLDETQHFSLSYATIDDNLMKETDGGHIYGVGYGYKQFDIKQYVSDYKHFNVYQTDVSYGVETAWNAWELHAKVLGKYMHLEDRKSNNFSKNAKENYSTVGVKLHAHYESYHFGAGAFFGERIFAVMNDGFKVQHHAMAFDKTYMLGLGKHFSWGGVHVKYVYQEATEVPIHNEGVEVQNLIVQVGYKF